MSIKTIIAFIAQFGICMAVFAAGWNIDRICRAVKAAIRERRD